MALPCILFCFSNYLIDFSSRNFRSNYIWYLDSQLIGIPYSSVVPCGPSPRNFSCSLFITFLFTSICFLLFWISFSRMRSMWSASNCGFVFAAAAVFVTILEDWRSRARSTTLFKSLILFLSFKLIYCRRSMLWSIMRYYWFAAESSGSLSYLMPCDPLIEPAMSATICYWSSYSSYKRWFVRIDSGCHYTYPIVLLVLFEHSFLLLVNIVSRVAALLATSPIRGVPRELLLVFALIFVTCHQFTIYK